MHVPFNAISKQATKVHNEDRNDVDSVQEFGGVALAQNVGVPPFLHLLQYYFCTGDDVPCRRVKHDTERDPERCTQLTPGS